MCSYVMLVDRFKDFPLPLRSMRFCGVAYRLRFTAMLVVLARSPMGANTLVKKPSAKSTPRRLKRSVGGTWRRDPVGGPTEVSGVASPPGTVRGVENSFCSYRRGSGAGPWARSSGPGLWAEAPGSGL